MPGVGIEMQVRHRNRFGQFASLLEAAGAGMARDMTETTAEHAHDFAPVGPARTDYGRRSKLTGSIFGEMVSRTVGIVRALAGHAAPQELGAGPHPIPNAWGSGRTVLHPGNPAQPYLRPAVAAMRAKVPAMLARWYPF